MHELSILKVVIQTSKQDNENDGEKNADELEEGSAKVCREASSDENEHACACEGHEEAVVKGVDDRVLQLGNLREGLGVLSKAIRGR